MKVNTILEGDALTKLKELPKESIDCVMTSPPYWALRDYGVEGQLGLEPTFEEFISNLCDVFDEVQRVLKPSGTCWVNIGDTYHGSGGAGGDWDQGSRAEQPKWKQPKNNILQNKCLVGIPFRFVLEMINRGWILRNTIIWHKPNCMPSSAKDRFTVDFEYIFFFTKNKKYYFEQQQIATQAKVIEKRMMKEQRDVYRAKYKDDQGTQRTMQRNLRCIWKICPQPFGAAHFACFPEALCETPIKAGCPKGGLVLDPFFGSGTVAVVAKRLKRNWLGIEINPEYIKIAERRLKGLKNWSVAKDIDEGKQKTL